MTDQTAGEGSEKGPDPTPSEGEKGGRQDPGGRNPFRGRRIEDRKLHKRLFDMVALLFPSEQSHRRREERRLSEQRRLNEEIRLLKEEARLQEEDPEWFDAPESVIPQLTEFVVVSAGATPRVVPEPTPTGSDDHDLPGLDDHHEGEVVGGGRTTMSLGGLIGAALVALVLFLGWFLVLRGDGAESVAVATSTTATSIPTAAAGSTEPTPTEEPPGDCVAGSGCDPAGDAGGTGGGPGATNEQLAAGDILDVGHRLGSHVFTLTVAGEGRAMADSEDTKWYNPRFVVAQTSDGATAYIVDGKWARGEPFDGDVLDASFSPIAGAEVTAEWIDASTAEFTVTGLSITDAPASFVMALSIRLLEPDGSDGATFDDDAFWEAP